LKYNTKSKGYLYPIIIIRIKSQEEE